MPKVKKLHCLEGARRRPKKPDAEQSAQIPSSGLNLLQALNACQDAELLSRIECRQRLAQEVDEQYEYKLFVGEGKQAQKRCAEYMRIQHDIFENLCEDLEELMRRVRLRKDILLLTQMQLAEPQARIVEDAKPAMPTVKHVGKGERAKENSDENAMLRTVMSTFLKMEGAGQVKFRGAPEKEKEPSAHGETK